LEKPARAARAYDLGIHSLCEEDRMIRELSARGVEFTEALG
jgi:hypothetical protein